jgi:hypothetical protein
MKTTKYILRFFAAACLLVLLSNCGGETTTAFGKTTFNILKAKSWKIKSVTVDGVDKTGSYLPDMVLTFAGDFDKNDLTYTTTNGGGAWPASGTFKFINDVKLLRDEEVTIDVTEFIVTSLKLEFDWDEGTTYGGGRTSGMKGRHVFQFE